MNTSVGWHGDAPFDIAGVSADLMHCFEFFSMEQSFFSETFFSLVSSRLARASNFRLNFHSSLSS